MPSNLWVMDSECYKDYYLVMLRSLDDPRITLSYSMYPGKSFDMPPVPDGMTLVTFNGNNYDMPILSLALAGGSNEILKWASDDIILRNCKPWDIERDYGGVSLKHIDHIDLIEVAPGQCSLKSYGGRMHSKRLQDLPIEPDASISPEQRTILILYCGNDLDTTIDLAREVMPQIQLRESMSKEFGIDLRSKSDAQIAEAVIRSEVEKKLQTRIYRPELHGHYEFVYRVPSFIHFQSPGMQHALNIIAQSGFRLDYNGSVVMPQIFDSMRLNIGRGTYAMGIGGLHSTESKICHKGNLIDRDVTSYYPAIVLNQRLFPAHMGEVFIEVYKALVDRRVAAKKTGDNVTNEVLKIVINGSFGKFGSKWSILYAPDLMIQVTLTGQLALLMLIELIELAGIPVVSANTDGVTMQCPPEREAELNAIIAAWEITTGFSTEESRYRLLAAKDVNNYVAIKTDGSAKQKGLYSFVGSKKSRLEKNPTNMVCIDAVIDALAADVSPEYTIRDCNDVRRFLSVRQVKGGAIYDEQYLGRVVRWYYATGCEGKTIRYASNNNKVPRTDGCKPLMELPERMPEDIDYDWYIKEAYDILKDLGL